MSKEEIILKLMQLALKIESETDKCVFINYSGHVDSIEVRIAESKKNYNNWLYDSRIYFDECNFLEKFNKLCESLKRYLS